MKTTFTILLSSLLFSFNSAMAQQTATEVILISTIHGAHKMNPNYTYDSLFAFIETFNPDIIGVEIRAEDIDSSLAYLKGNYPYEMYECLERYSSKKVLGFDWLGDDIAGQPIPKDYWKEKSEIKRLQKQLAADSIQHQRLSVTDIITAEKNHLALNASLRELNDGRYDLINRIYYTQLTLLLQGTDYAALSDFYKRRDEQIAQHILDIITANPGRKMLFLIGADHRAFTLSKLSEAADESIRFNHF
jgi:hypothetical protein